ncbi:hypothetical protein ACWCP6_15105 [Streptomyces sp. NPDC002004]
MPGPSAVPSSPSVSGDGRPAAPRTGPAAASGVRPRTPVSEVVRWGAFGCAVVPVILICSGASAAGVIGVTLGLAAATAVCRVLLRESERALNVSKRASRGRKYAG